MKTVLAHFYFATAAANASGVAAWHVAVFDIAESMDDVAALGGAAQRERTLNMAQAIEAGVTLEQVAAEFTAATAAAYAVAQDEIERLTGMLETAGAALEQARARIMVLEAARPTDEPPA